MGHEQGGRRRKTVTPRILALVMGYIMYGEWVEAEGRSALNSPPHGCVSSL